MKKTAFILFAVFTINLNVKAQQSDFNQAKARQVQQTQGVCSVTPCSFVNEGTFEGITCNSYPDYYMNCWKTLVGSPDIITRSCALTIPKIKVAANTYNDQSVSYDPACSDSYSGPGTGNDAFLGLYGGKTSTGYWEEGVQVSLGTPLVPGQNYVLSFWGKVNKKYDGLNGTNLPANIAFDGMPGAVAQFMNGVNQPIPNLVSGAVQLGNTVTVANDDQWHYYQQTFTFTGSSNHYEMAVIYNAFDASYSSMTKFDAYVYLDDITLNSVGGIPIVTNPPPLCTGQTIPNLNAYVSIPGGVFSGAGVVNTGGVYSFNPGTLALGNHTVFYTYTNGSCVYHQAIVVTIVNGNISATLSNQTVCSTTCTNLIPVVSGTSPFTYLWSTSATSSSINVCPLTTTSYQVQVTNAVGCVATANSVVTVNQTPVITANNATICSGSSCTLQASGANSYIWTPATALNCTTCANPTANPVVTTLYTVTGTTNGCSSSQQVNVTVNPLPTMSVWSAPNTPTCPGTFVILAASGAPSNTFQWSTGGNAPVTAPQLNIITQNTAVYTVTGTLNGCSASANVTIVVNPAPVLVVTPNQTVCPGDVATITVSGGTTYNWTNSNTLSSNYASTVIASPTSSTTYMVTSTNSFNCTGMAQTTVYVKPKPEIRNSSSPVGTPTGFYSSLPGTNYVWTASSATIPAVTFNGQGTGAISNVAWNVNCTAAKTFEQVTLTLDGCKTSQYFARYCNPGTVALFPISGPIAVTPGSTQTYVIQNNSVPLLPNITWVCDGGTVISGQGTGTATIQWAKGYRGKVGFYAMNGTSNGQNGSLDVSVCTLTPPVNNFTAGDITLCQSWGFVLLDAGNATTAASYAWSTSAASQTIHAPYTSNGIIDYYYATITNTNGCKSTFMQSVDNISSCRVSSQRQASSLGTIEDMPSALFFPNPATNIIYIESTTNNSLGSIVIQNLLGETVYEGSNLSSKAEINISHFPTGVYTIFNQGVRSKLIKE